MATIPKMAERKEAMRLWEAAEAADAAYQAQNYPDPDPIGEKYRALHQELEERENEERGWAGKRAAKRAADKALDDYPEQLLLRYLAGEHVVACCGKSGVVLLESDEIVEDPESGEIFLRSALGLPPRPEEKDDELEEAA
jgi:hypothetical protein